AGLELLAEGRLPDVAGAGRPEAQARHELKLGAHLPAVDLAARRIVGAAEGEVRIDAPPAAVRRPDRQIELAEPLPYVELARCPARGREQMQRSIAAGDAGGHAANADLFRIRR